MPRRDRPSQTAVKVARGVASMGVIAELDALLPPGASTSTTALLRAVGLLARWQQAALRRPWVARGASRLDVHWMGGVARAGALRKRFVEDETRAGIDAGAEQVLIIGAGFDTLASRLGPRYFETRFIELDHPPTHRLKREAVTRLGEPVPNIDFIAADLSARPLDEVLRRIEGWKRDAATVVVAEGVLMYLEQNEVRSLFERVHASTGPGTRVVFTYVGCDGTGRPTLGRLGGLGWATKTALKLLGEPLRWCIEGEGLPDFLRPCGFSLAGDVQTDLHARYLVPLGRADEPVSTIERMAVALRR